ncbi:acylphosphatase [Chitinilyticum piscinae]|uniref:Acylphosphatase n=1 Tax=Chitinilyticum piscinae TaxID=2866724 RepID=A0A8J7K8L4_9NEIS|nr:acylphosphatase [Chitinilyticum piscinae]MBE9609673.1 acylphosphatase [Chitinilyticum piscinae]
MHALRYRIEGRVQGVGFRYHTCIRAQALGLTGWVRNRRDGSVEVHAEGTEYQLAQLTGWLQHGEPPARVRSVRVCEALYEGMQDFSERPTA